MNGRNRNKGLQGLLAGVAGLMMLTLALSVWGQEKPAAGAADPQSYLSKITESMTKPWPFNRRLNIVCHGHSVPAGFFATPEVHTLEAYPHLMLKGLCARFPCAQVNMIVTAIGGENSNTGAARFEKQVLNHLPDVVTIDYALNDRGCVKDDPAAALVKARANWVSMIEKAKARKVAVILMTPTPDKKANLDDPKDPLNLHAEQIRQLAKEYHVGLVDSLAIFKEYLKKGGKLDDVMSQVNHPNRKGHEMVAAELLKWFPVVKK